MRQNPKFWRGYGRESGRHLQPSHIYQLTPSWADLPAPKETHDTLLKAPRYDVLQTSPTTPKRIGLDKYDALLTAFNRRCDAKKLDFVPEDFTAEEQAAIVQIVIDEMTGKELQAIIDRVRVREDSRSFADKLVTGDVGDVDPFERQQAEHEKAIKAQRARLKAEAPQKRDAKPSPEKDFSTRLVDLVSGGKSGGSSFADQLVESVEDK